MSRLSGKWRPALWMVLGGALLGTLALSFAGLIALRYLGPEIGFRRAATALALLILCATLGLGLLLARLLLRPVVALNDQAAMLRSNPQHELPALQHFGTRELGALAHSITAMAQMLQQREAQVRSFTDHVTHELKTPVTVVRAAAELLSDGPLGPADQALVAQILGATRQMQTQLEALRRVTAARQPGHHGQTTLAALLPQLRQSHPDLTLIAQGTDLPILLGEAGLRIVLDHLLGNAAQHTARTVTLAATRTASQTATQARLTVTDDGPGISNGNRARIFDAFFTTRRDQGGTGMGLTIVANLLQAHGATIDLTPTETGASFTITFPTSKI